MPFLIEPRTRPHLEPCVGVLQQPFGHPDFVETSHHGPIADKSHEPSSELRGSCCTTPGLPCSREYVRVLLLRVHQVSPCWHFRQSREETYNLVEGDQISC